MEKKNNILEYEWCGLGAGIFDKDEFELHAYFQMLYSPQASFSIIYTTYLYLYVCKLWSDAKKILGKNFLPAYYQHRFIIK